MLFPVYVMNCMHVSNFKLCSIPSTYLKTSVLLHRTCMLTVVVNKKFPFCLLRVRTKYMWLFNSQRLAANYQRATYIHTCKQNGLFWPLLKQPGMTIIITIMKLYLILGGWEISQGVWKKGKRFGQTTRENNQTSCVIHNIEYMYETQSCKVIDLPSEDNYIRLDNW